MPVNLYVPKEKDKIVERAKEVLKRRGTNMSIFMLEKLEEVALELEKEWELEELKRLKAKYELNNTEKE